jgi:hypothetical protein
MTQKITLDLDISDTAAGHVRLKFNPSNLDKVARLKTIAAALLTEYEKIRDADNGYAAREGACAITNLQTASMWGVLAATKGL